MPTKPLPCEVLLHLFDHFQDTEDTSSLISCAQVNSSWHEVVMKYIIWRSVKFTKNKSFFAFLEVLRMISWTKEKRALSNWAKLVGEALKRMDLKGRQAHIHQITKTYWHSTHPYGLWIKALDLSNLNGKDKISDSVIGYLFRQTPNLIRVNLYNCYMLTDMAIDALTIECVHLQELNIFGCTNFTSKSLELLQKRCRGLIKLEMGMCNRDAALFKREWPSLQSLDLSFISDLTDLQILEIARNTPNLRYLNVSFSSLSAEFLWKILPLLPQLRAVHIPPALYLKISPYLQLVDLQSTDQRAPVLALEHTQCGAKKMIKFFV
ncbi:hypothetical protein G9A89_014957 [Geosiphon pyriformis]|nr:hypothetical protein G9A89_014957 [Geosiphon pyriformis]